MIDKSGDLHEEMRDNLPRENGMAVIRIIQIIRTVHNISTVLFYGLY